MAVWPLVAILEITGAQALVTLDLVPVTLDQAPVEILVALGHQPTVEILVALGHQPMVVVVVEVDHGQTQGLLEAVVMVVLPLEDHLPELLL